MKPIVIFSLCGLLLQACATEPEMTPEALAAANAVYADYQGHAEAGRRQFLQCHLCHSIQPGENKAGPSLAGIVGRPAGQAPGFHYSKANRASHIVWTEEKLFAYLHDPDQVVPGTTMGYNGLKDPQARADLIAFLKANAK